MLVIHPSSSCDNCSEPFKLNENQNLLTLCSHVLCKACLDKLPQPKRCPKCHRVHFFEASIIELHATFSPSDASKEVTEQVSQIESKVARLEGELKEAEKAKDQYASRVKDLEQELCRSQSENQNLCEKLVCSEESLAKERGEARIKDARMEELEGSLSGSQSANEILCTEVARLNDSLKSESASSKAREAGYEKRIGNLEISFNQSQSTNELLCGELTWLKECLEEETAKTEELRNILSGSQSETKTLRDQLFRIEESLELKSKEVEMKDAMIKKLEETLSETRSDVETVRIEAAQANKMEIRMVETRHATKIDESENNLSQYEKKCLLLVEEQRRKDAQERKWRGRSIGKTIALLISSTTELRVGKEAVGPMSDFLDALEGVPDVFFYIIIVWSIVKYYSS